MQWDGVHALVQQAKQGDKQSWEQLCSLTEPYLMHRAENLLGPGWRQRSVPDLVSKTWLQAIQGLDSFVGGDDDSNTGASLRAWLTTIMKNIFRNAVRDGDRRPSLLTGCNWQGSAAVGESTVESLQPVSQEPAPGSSSSKISHGSRLADG